MMSRRGRTPPGMPALEKIPADAREALSVWMQEKFRDIEYQHQQRVDMLRTVGEHPSPVFSQMIQKFGALGIEKSLVAKLMNISTTFLDTHYGEDYDVGKAEILSSIAANAVRIATSTTDPNAAKVAMDILDRRGGEEWRKPAQKLEVESKSAKPPVIDSSALTYEERRQLEAMLDRITNPNPELPAAEGENAADDEPAIE